MTTMTRRRFATVAAFVSAAVLAGALPRASRADDAKPRVEIVVLLAKKDPKGGHVDAEVAKLPQLTQKPFSDYNSYTLLDKKTLTLDQVKPADPWKGKPSATYALANGKPLAITLIDRLADARFQMGAAMGKDAPDLVRWSAPAGEPVFIAGQSYKDGILVVGITLRP
jgi:hypothetical protein